MAEYAIYSYEVQEGNKSLLYKDTGEKCIEKAKDIIGNILHDRLTIIGKKRKVDLTLRTLHYTDHDDIYTWILCNEKDVKYYEGHESKSFQSHPGSYVIVDNREGVFQIAIERNSAFDMDTDKVAKYLQQSLNIKLSEYGLKVVIKHKFRTDEFRKIIRKRLVTDHVRKIVFDFPNPDKVKGIDAFPQMRGQLEGMRLITQATNALRGKLILSGGKGNPLCVDDDKISDLSQLISLCAQNSYNITYYFYNSSTIAFKNSVFACHVIENKAIIDFEYRQIVDYGEGSTYDLIRILDEIRTEIAGCNDEKIIEE